MKNQFSLIFLCCISCWGLHIRCLADNPDVIPSTPPPVKSPEAAVSSRETGIEFPSYVPDPAVQTPQAAGIMQYDNTVANLNSGRIDVSIPLISLIDKDFDFPIALSYDSGGFKPADPDNYVGRNWTLICGGAVTREINGMPDDLAQKQVGKFGKYSPIKGFLHRYRQGEHTIQSSKFKKQILASPYEYATRTTQHLLSIKPLTDIETTADLYHFQACGIAGKFRMNYDGTISSGLTSGAGDCSVDLSLYKLVNAGTLNSAIIQLKTDTQYTYTFGGNTFAPLEYTAMSWEHYFQSNLEPGASVPANEISAYYLTKIKAPNGRELIIQYRDINATYHANPGELVSTNKDYLVQQNVNLQYSVSGEAYVWKGYAPLYDYQPFNPLYKYTLTKQALIDRVETDEFVVNFYYSRRAVIPYYGGGTMDSFAGQCGAKLDSVVMSSKHSNYKETTRLEYEYNCGNRLFLKAINNSLRGVYYLEYNTNNCNVSPTTTNIDHWGYWRGSSEEPTYIAPRFPADHPGIYTEDNCYTFVTDDRTPTGSRQDATLLNKIIYPTGGFSKFEYEPHYYSNRLLYQPGNYEPRLQRCSNTVAGGARIHRISHYTEQNSVPVKEVWYKYDPYGIQGDLMFMPFYRFPQTTAKDAVTYHISGYVINSNGVNSQIHRGEYIRYPAVAEYYIDVAADSNGSTPLTPRKVTHFTNYGINPDQYDFRAYFDTFSSLNIGLTSDVLYQHYGMRMLALNLGVQPDLNAENERGQIQSELYYDAANKLIQRDDYEYERMSCDTAVYFYSHPIFSGLFADAFTHIGLETFNKYLLKKKTVHIFDTAKNEALSTHKDYFYNSMGYLLSENTVREQGDSTIVTYTYANGYRLPPDKTVYDASKKGRQVTQTERYKSVSVTNPSLNSSWNVIAGYSVGDGQTTKSMVDYSKFDAYGNPCQRKDINGLSTVYIWGYQGKYLLAQIENATHAEVKFKLGVAPETLSHTDFADIAKLNQLRQSLPNAKITTYSYIPFVGLRTSTDPDGHTTMYTYDDHGRMTAIYKQSDGGTRELLQHNEYRILNE